MTHEIIYSPLVDRDIAKLAEALHCEAVYKYIGGMPSRADFELWLRQSLKGPPTQSTDAYWINITVRIAKTGEIIGRLEANVHDYLAEVAFLYSPKLWGLGYASKGLVWLQDYLHQHKNIHSLWATTHPENQRSASLLLRCGFAAVSTQDSPLLHSYDEGDFLFHRSMA
jgi:RimJ/RimL family protein N-acetyltransferase